jgi:hypothetical protein
MSEYGYKKGGNVATIMAESGYSAARFPKTFESQKL